jgi:hypothetical protein
MGGAAPISSPRMEPTLKIYGYCFGNNGAAEELVTIDDVVAHLSRPDVDGVQFRIGRRKALILGGNKDGSVSVNVYGPGRDHNVFHKFTDLRLAGLFAASEVRSR